MRRLGLRLLPRLLAAAAGLAAAALLAEGGVRLGHRALVGGAFPVAELAARRDRIRTVEAWRRLIRGERFTEVVHPYLGFVRDPGAVRPGDPPVSDLGFSGAASPLDAASPESPGRVVVGVFGGSLAEQWAHVSSGLIAARLAEAPPFRGREVVVLPLALGGYKQPQQLTALAYLLALGGRFDVVVNVDGFNEVVLPAVENVPKAIFPFYPRGWYARAAELPDRRILEVVARITLWEDRRTAWAALFDRAPLGASAAANLAWSAGDAAAEDAIRRWQEGLVAIRLDSAPYQVSGPRRVYADDTAMHADLAAVWAASSLQMHRLCAAAGARYYHVLQPNQYVEGSKALAPEERAAAYDDRHPYRPAATAGYPHLRREGARLKALGVRFLDMTGVFSDVEAPVYADACCHLNVEGNRILAEAVLREIVADLAVSSRPRPPPKPAAPPNAGK